MSVSHPDSALKTLKQISVVSKHSFKCGKEVYYPPESVVISNSFWREYHCPPGCGGCCPAFTLDYLPAEWEHLCGMYREAGTLGNERAVVANSVARSIYTIYPLKEENWCRFVDKALGTCHIHRANPYSCRSEPIKFRVIRGIGYLMKAPFGRAWNMHRVVDGGPILCSFTTFSEKQFWESDIPILQQLEEWASHWNIETHISEIIKVTSQAVKTRHITRIEISEPCGLRLF